MTLQTFVYDLRYPESTDNARLWEHFKNLADDTEAALTAIGGARAVRREMVGDHTLTNQTTYAILPQAADRTALTISFVKVNASTRLILDLSCSVSLTSGVSQKIWVGLRIASTDYDLAKCRFLVAPYRLPISGQAEVTGLAAGTYSIQPVVKAEGASAVGLYAGDDWISYSVREAM